MTGSTNNTWGLGFSETFDVFGSTANNDPSFYVAIPNRYLRPASKGCRRPSAARRQRPGLSERGAVLRGALPRRRTSGRWTCTGGYTAAAGHHLYTARAFPKEYWNRIAFITEPTAHLVGQGIMESQGAGFVDPRRLEPDRGAEEWVAPVHAQVGPDGAVWVADWYNFIAQHNPTPPGYSNGKGNAYETSLRDQARGRIYRIVYRNAPPAKKRSCRRPIRPDWSRRWRPTTCSGGCTRSVCSSSAARRTSCRSWSRSSRNHGGRRDRHQRRRDARAVDAARPRRARPRRRARRTAPRLAR